MNKKLLIGFTVLTIGLTSAASIGSGIVEAKTSADFSDLKDLDAATKAKFDAMISAGIFNGVSDASFGLKEEMNRAQFAKVAALIFGLNVNQDLKTSSFSDVKSDDTANGYALPFIEAIKAAGITDGVGGGAFNPAGQVTKEQLAAFLVRGLGQEAQAQSASGVSDNTVSDWAQGYVRLALEQRLLDNSPNGTFGGTTQASRELLATGSFESARTFEATGPLEVSGANFAAGNKLELTMTVGIDPNSFDLSKIMVNGVPLDPKLDSYVLSEDRKTIIIKLHEGFKLDTSRAPVIVANGLKTLFGNDVKNNESKPISVKVTVPPMTPPVTPPVVTYTPSTPTPDPVPVPTDVTLSIDVMNGTIMQTTASYPVTGSVTGTVYYSVLSSGSAVPSLAGIKSGNDAVVYGSVELDGTKGNLSLSGLTAGTSYVLYAYELANGRTSKISSVRFQTLAEQQVVPTITFNASGTSRSKGITSDTIHASVNSEAFDTLHYVLTEFNSSDSPSVAQVKSGQDVTGNPALQQGTVDMALQGISISENLQSNKTYRLYVVGSKGTLDSEVAGFTFYRTDPIIDTFTSVGTPVVNDNSITVSPDYRGSEYRFYYLTTDQGMDSPSADYIVNQGGVGMYDSVYGTVSIQGTLPPGLGLYAVIVAYDQESDDEIRSNVVTFKPTF
ncbi:S-layer homology domain-containing protein [Paenibacillus dokdonensis]|uniref:S-layer homology domain-containing protein n=1 Tax=Paenibacillus dokdonensis TaxID=2567944 RepID=UPI0010A92920|nr:S-layer homology domain-containing protein [Paenibacillus dokdonensis]